MQSKARLVEMPEGDISLALVHYQGRFQTIALRYRRGFDPDFLPQGDRTCEEANLNSFFRTSNPTLS
jgi:hypothetical protein